MAKNRHIYFTTVLSIFLYHGAQALDWPWNWKKEDVTCYSTCLAAVGTGAVPGTPLALSAAGFGAAGVVGGSLAAKIMSMIGVVKAGSWFAFLQTAGVSGIGVTGKMILASTVSPMCAAICGTSEERQDLKCYTQKLDGMKGLDEYILKAETVRNLQGCDSLCEDEAGCRAFRFLPKNRFCFLYSLQQYIEDDVESEFYVKRCILCYMNSTENTKGPDDEVTDVRELSSFTECEKNCIKTDNCKAVHYDGKRCWKFNSKVEPKERTNYHFSQKICVMFSDVALENQEGDKYKDKDHSG